MNANQIFARQFAGRQFQVYSIASGEALSKPADFNTAYADLVAIGRGSGFDSIPNGIDIREVK